MKGVFYKISTLCLLIATLLVYTGCKKDEPITPQATSASNDALAKLAATNPIMVSTYVRSIAGNRICSDGTGNIYVTVPYEGIYKISPGGVVKPFYLAKLPFFALKAAKNGDIYTTVGGNKIAKISQSGVFTPIEVNVIYGLYLPYDLAIAPDNTLYIADTGNNRIVKVTPDGTASVLAGNGVTGLEDGVGNKAKFNNVTTIKLSADGYLWVIDGNGPRRFKSVRRVTLQGAVTTVKLIPFVYGNDEIQNTSITDLAVAKRDKNFNRSPVESLFLAYGIAKLTHMTTTGVETPISRHSVFAVYDGPIDTALFAGASGICINDNRMYIMDNHFNVIRRVMKKD
ncbi:hypothetical protein IM792_08795 [Mucilaginibacter sp. JRF]|uniref:hypothetical protein n=1 Tax=Mucilaginibacter sp. JRF TaxID=2780088 RepID=UPI00187F1499|nr:hypothetical protein [Mucilaginibacter sp. JRF]MBE9584542.1 hypothetical protein [Mucilaginibacter sp. JRF]